MKYISSGGLSSSNTFFIISAVMLNGIFAHTLYGSFTDILYLKNPSLLFELFRFFIPFR